MLDDNVSKHCRKLDVNHKKFEKSQRSMGIGIMILAMLGISALFIVEIDDIADRPEISFPLLIIGFISIVLVIHFHLKSNGIKEDGLDYFLVRVYRMYVLVQSYKSDEDFDHIKKIISKMDTLIYKLEADLERLKRSFVTFDYLEEEIERLRNNLDYRIIPELDSGKPNTQKIEYCFEKIIDFIIENRFENLSELNKIIEDSFEDQSIEEDSLGQRIRSNTYIMKILGSSGIIGGAGIVSYLAKISTDANNIDFVTWWIVLSASFVTGYLWKTK